MAICYGMFDSMKTIPFAENTEFTVNRNTNLYHACLFWTQKKRFSILLLIVSCKWLSGENFKAIRVSSYFYIDSSEECCLSNEMNETKLDNERINLIN